MKISVFPPAAVILGALVLPAADTTAGVREPSRSDVGVPCDPLLRSIQVLIPGPLPCQYRFRADGAMDALRVILTLRDCYDNPIAGCAVKATVVPTAGTLALCGCEPLDPIRVTAPTGVVDFVFQRLGGRGSAEVRLTLVDVGRTGFPPLGFDFTSPDLSGSCEPGSSTTVIDLAIWARGLREYERASDYDCSGTVGVVDLGGWAGGLGVGCP